MEFYDPNQPVCNNQDDFNIAIRKAVKYDLQQTEKKAKPFMYVSAALMFIFIVWAMLLAMQIPRGPERISHLVFAIVFSPVYVIGYYLGMMGSGAKMGCGCSDD